MTTTFGIEEEFVLLDPLTLTTVDRPDAVARVTAVDGVVAKEFFPSQIEYASPVCRTADEALDAIVDFRTRLAEWSVEARAVPAGIGTPFRISASSHPTLGERYARIADDIAGVLTDHQINGLHVHVGFDDRDDRVRASNALRPWLPTLLAISANSPFWQGVDTGFASWRGIHSRRWTTYGVPPHFASAAHYDDLVESLRGIGATSDINTINWSVRLSAQHPTVEVRIFDAQLDPWSTLALALLTRILAQHAPQPATPPTDVVMDAALWHAARYGTRTDLVHPVTLRLAPARQVIDDLSALVAPHLASDLERACVDDLLMRVADGTTGSALQLAAYADGEAGLARLYEASLTRTPDHARRDLEDPLAAVAP